MLTFEKLLQNSQFLEFSLSIYYNRPFVELEQWEQREVISFFDRAELAITSDLKLIVYNISNNIEYTWSNLSIIEEAIVQRELRLAGYEIICHGLNIFPTSTASMAVNIRKLAIIPVEVNNNHKIATILSDYQYLIISIFLIMMLYIGYINIVGGLIVGYIITAILSFFMHEYAQHNSRYQDSKYIITIKPLFNWIIHIIAYIYMPSLTPANNTGDIRSHILHHKMWKSDIDGIMGSIKENWFKHLGNPARSADKHDSAELLDTINMSTYKSKWLFNNFLISNRIYILSIIHLIIIVLFGFTAYVSYFVFPTWYFVIVVGATTDFFFHSPYQNRTPPKDGPWWTVPIWFNLTYHISHHAKPNILFFGEGWIKYINLQYWIFLLAYTTDETNSNKIY